jgi:uncharacterized protein
MRQTLKISFIIIIAFGLFYFLNKNYFFNIYDWLGNLIHLKIVAYFLAHVIVGLPLIIALFLIHKPKDLASSIGINKGFGKGLFFAFLCTFPMLIGYSFFFKFNIKITCNEIFSGVIFAAFFEELYFRGILFGQLFRYARIGFIPSVLICAVLFAAGHLWQSSDFSVLIGIFATTFLGAIFFAWTYIEWDNNLWVPMGLHLFMNLYWNLFSAGNNALGGFYSNIFRILTITLVICGTLFYKKRKGIKLIVNRNNLWVNKTHLKPTVDNI